VPVGGALFAGTKSVKALRKVTADLVVNTTPLGMAPDVDGCPWPAELPLPEGAAVYDLVYNPLETRLASKAAAQGLRAATGLGMLVAQAALAFALWTGMDAPFTVMERAARAGVREGEA
jgi:shikimate dehydrogenase